MPVAKGFLLDIVRAAMDQKEKAMGTDCLVLNLPILQGRRRKQNRMRPSCKSSTKESPTCLHGKSACRKVRAALYSPISGHWQGKESRPNPYLNDVSASGQKGARMAILLQKLSRVDVAGIAEVISATGETELEWCLGTESNCRHQSFQDKKKVSKIDKIKTQCK